MITDVLNTTLTKVFNAAFFCLGISSSALAFDSHIVLNVSIVDPIIEFIKTSLALSLGVLTFLMQYIINHKVINTWFRSISWLNKKKKHVSNIKENNNNNPNNSVSTSSLPVD